MAQYNFVVFTNPVAGREDEYNHWYTGQHLGDVLAVPGFVAARRFRVADPGAGAPHRYRAIYEIESNDLQKTFAELFARAGTPAMVVSDALDQQNVVTYTYEAITERRTT